MTHLSNQYMENLYTKGRPNWRVLLTLHCRMISTCSHHQTSWIRIMHISTSSTVMKLIFKCLTDLNQGQCSHKQFRALKTNMLPSSSWQIKEVNLWKQMSWLYNNSAFNLVRYWAKFMKPTSSQRLALVFSKACIASTILLIKSIEQTWNISSLS